MSPLQRQLLARSERDKGIDFHPHEPWILTTLYSGQVYIWSYETQQVVKASCPIPGRLFGKERQNNMDHSPSSFAMSLSELVDSVRFPHRL